MEYINLNIESWSDLILLFSILINVSIGLVVLFKNSTSISHRAFFFIVFLLGLWVFGNYQIDKVAYYNYKLFWTRTTGVAVSYVIGFFYLFANIFPGDKFKDKFTRFFSKLIFSVSTILALIFLFTNLIIKSINIEDFPVTVNYSFGYFPFIIWVIIIFILSIISLLNKRKSVSPTLRIHILLITIGLVGMFISSTITNIILPMLGYTQYTRIGTASTIIFISVTSYGIIRHQLLDIRFILGKITYYILIATPIYITYFSLAYIYEYFFKTSLNTFAFIGGIPIAITFTVLFILFTKFVSEYTDTHLINPGYNPLVVLEQHSQKLSNTLDIDNIIQESLFTIARTIRPDSSGIILIDESNPKKWLSINYKKPPYEATHEFKIFTEYLLIQNRKFISYYDLLVNSSFRRSDLKNKHLASALDKYNLRIILALKEEATVKGLLLVGKKEADDPYNSQEIKFLERIADNISLSLGRALLYKETQQFNIELQQKISDATLELQTKNKDLEEAFAQLEEVRRQEKDMLDVMGHELRTPISISRNALLALQNSLNKNTADPVKIKRYIDMAAEGARREIALVETLLSTTKLEGSRMQINPEPVDLKTAVSYSVRSHKEFAQKGRTELVFIEPKESIVVTADKIRIQEIIDNFINNAIKYTGEGKVEVSIEKKDGLGWVSVKDNGIGISEENLKHLGKKFFRVQQLYNQSNNKVNPSGTGLGLFVSFQLIELMKGKKSIISKEGKGSTFSFGLPISKKLPST